MFARVARFEGAEFAKGEERLAREVDRALDAMSPADGGPSGRVGVDLLQVVFDEAMS